MESAATASENNSWWEQTGQAESVKNHDKHENWQT